MKDHLDHFEHDTDARNHPKIKALKATYGWEGVGRFWALNEIIAGCTNAQLDLSKKVYQATAAEDLGLSLVAFNEFLSFLGNKEECGLVMIQDGIVTTSKTSENWKRLSDYRERERARKDAANEKRNAQTGKTRVSTLIPSETSSFPAENNGVPAESEPSLDKLSSVQISRAKKEDPPKSPDVVAESFPVITSADFALDPKAGTTTGPTRYHHGADQINAFFALWNSLGLPEFRKLLINVPNAGELREALSFYAAEEVESAIRAYHTVQTDPGYDMGFRYQTVVNFLVKGLEAFAPGAKPLEAYAKKESAMTDEQRDAEKVRRALEIIDARQAQEALA